MYVKKDRGPVITPGPTLTNPDQTTALQQSATSSTITPADTTTVDPNPIDLNKTIKQTPYTVPDGGVTKRKKRHQIAIPRSTSCD